MFGRGNKEKNIQKMLDNLSPDEKNDLLALLQGDNEKGENASENSTASNVENQNTTNPNDEKPNEVAKTTDEVEPVVSKDNQQNEQEKQGNLISVDDIMLKDDFKKYVEDFEKRYNVVIKEKEEMQLQNETLAKENEELKQKYENTSFGNYTTKSTDGKVEPKKNETFDDYANQFFNR